MEPQGTNGSLKKQRDQKGQQKKDPFGYKNKSMDRKSLGIKIGQSNAGGEREFLTTKYAIGFTWHKNYPLITRT